MRAFPRLATIILPAALRDAGNQAALQFDPLGGAQTFREPFLSADGNEPATHTAASGLMTEPTFAAVAGMIPQFPGGQLYEGMSVDEVLQKSGLMRTIRPN